MRKLLISTTALSVAMSSFHTLPARAQTLAEDGSVIGPDGSVLCAPTADAPCDLQAIIDQLNEAEAAAQPRRKPRHRRRRKLPLRRKRKLPLRRKRKLPRRRKR
ncbi:MAG: hypothetical protein HC844_10180, partial [Tabrizicola sp.]|nr:hypothetical protein [Tabrizicola sp.]